MKKLNREEVYKFNRSLSINLQYIWESVENIQGYEEPKCYEDDVLQARMKDIQDAFIALKKELLNMSKEKEEK